MGFGNEGIEKRDGGAGGPGFEGRTFYTEQIPLI